MAKKMPRDDRIAGEEEVRRMEAKCASLKEDYMDLERDFRAARKRMQRETDKTKLLGREVRFLWRKYQMFTEKNREEPADPSISPEFGAKILSVHKKTEEPTEVLAIEDEPIGLQPSAMRTKTAPTVPHGLLVTPIVGPANKKRCRQNNGLISAEKPSKIKKGLNKKIKAAPFVSQECGAEVLSISGNPEERTQEDESARQELTELTALQLLSSRDDFTSTEMTGQQHSAVRIMPTFTVPPSLFGTPIVEAAKKNKCLQNNELVSAQKPSTVTNGRNEEIKATPFVSQKCGAENLSISRNPKEPTQEHGPARHELTGLQLFSSRDDCPSTETTGLQTSAMRIMTTPMVPTSLVTPIVEPAKKNRCLQNNELVSAHKPPKVKNNRNKQTKAAPFAAQECGAEVLPISRNPKEPTQEDGPARHELTGLQLFSSTDDCPSTETTGLQPSAMRKMTTSTAPTSLLVTPIFEQAKKNRCLQNNELVSAQKPSKLKNDRNKKIKAAPFISQERGAEILSIFRNPKEPTQEDVPAKNEFTGLQLPFFRNPKEPTQEDGPAKHELTGLQLPFFRNPKEPTQEDGQTKHELTGPQLFLYRDDCPSTETTRLQPSAMRIMTTSRARPSLSGTPIVEPAKNNRFLQHNELVGAQKPSKVKNSRNKKIKPAPFVSRECGAEILSISGNPKEPTQEDGAARHELTGLQLFSSRDYCPSPETTGLQPSAMKRMPAFAAPESSLGMTLVKTTIKRKTSVQKPSEVEDSPRKKMKDSPQKPTEGRSILFFGQKIII